MKSSRSTSTAKILSTVSAQQETKFGEREAAVIHEVQAAKKSEEEARNTEIKHIECVAEKLLDAYENCISRDLFDTEQCDSDFNRTLGSVVDRQATRSTVVGKKNYVIIKPDGDRIYDEFNGKAKDCLMFNKFSSCMKGNKPYDVDATKRGGREEMCSVMTGYRQ
jgi:hypothetical protein